MKPTKQNPPHLHNPPAADSIHSTLLPCYALLLIGMLFTGFMSWLFVCRSLYRENRKKACYISLGINVAFFAALFWFNSFIAFPWWHLIVQDRIIHLLWAMLACFTQLKLLGRAQRQFDFSQWKKMITPIVTGIVIGICGGVIISLPNILQERTAVVTSFDILDRTSILLDFFKYMFIGAPIGLLLGLWWSRKPSAFRPSNIIAVLTGSAFSSLILFLLVLLLRFYLQKGHWEEFEIDQYKALIPPWQRGFPAIIKSTLDAIDLLSMLLFGLFFSSITRIRDFFRYSLLAFIVFFLWIPGISISPGLQEMLQDQLLYDMSDPDPGVQAKAFKKAEIMLKRYPDHQKWPSIAIDLARYHYDNNQVEKAKALYQKIASKYETSNYWYWSAKLARDILQSDQFGNSENICRLPLPVVDYESYLNSDWMAVLSNIKYWEGDSVPESAIKMRLQRLSKSIDKIKVKKLRSLIDFDDAIQSLGYRISFTPAGLQKAKTLLDAGFPVFYRSYTSDRLIFGYDFNKGVLYGYSFSYLSSRLKDEAPKEIKEMASHLAEGEGKSRQRLERIANEAFLEINMKMLKEPYRSYFSPFMYIIYPPQKTKELQQALAMDSTSFAKQDKGYKAALIALEHYDKKALVKAIAWAQTAIPHIDDPFPYYVGYVSFYAWGKRKSYVKSVLPLDKHFHELAKYSTELNSLKNQDFYKECVAEFETAFANHTLPFIIADRFDDMLYITNRTERAKSLEILKYECKINPGWSSSWRTLLKLYEFNGDLDGMYAALTGLISVSRYNYNARIQLVKAMIQKDEISNAKKTMEMVVADSVKYDADYYFCRGALAEADGDVKGALKNYEKCSAMRRYKSEYFWQLGSFLVKQEKMEKASGILAWAAKIDTSHVLDTEKQALIDRVSQYAPK